MTPSFRKHALDYLTKLLNARRNLQWSIDRLYRDLEAQEAELNKYQEEILQHCEDFGIKESDIVWGYSSQLNKITYTTKLKGITMTPE